MQKLHNYIKEREQEYQQWRDVLLADPETRAIYKEEATKKEL